MIHHVPRRSQNSKQEWLSAISRFSSLRASMGLWRDSLRMVPSPEAIVQRPEKYRIFISRSTYWNQDLRYGFRSIAGDIYTASGGEKVDNVIVTSSGKITPSHKDISVSYYKDTPIDQIDKSLSPGSPRAYSRLPHGIAVIQGDLDSSSAKTIFSTLHSD